MDKDPRKTWQAIVTAGGLMPVSDNERARHSRVQATFRAIYGLGPDATDDQLIDARAGDPRLRSVRGVAELATAYLRDYATRLIPDDNLEDVDRAALAWRDTPPDTPLPDLLDLVEQAAQPSLFDATPWERLLQQM